MKIALAQIKLSESIRENENKILDCFEKAAQNGAKLLCFPELQFSLRNTKLRAGCISQQTCGTIRAVAHKESFLFF